MEGDDPSNEPRTNEYFANDDSNSQGISEQDYLKLFDDFSDQNISLRNELESLNVQPDQDSRLKVIINYLQKLQKQNELLYNLLVEINNNQCQ